ncbi:phosphatidylglycerophosphatase A, partial [methanotrophic bacterial endosymbiont of Bathymodiolus sp.]
MFLTKVGKNQLSPREILLDPVLCLAFGFGSGLAKKAPGTFGTLAAVPIYLVLIQTNLWIYSIVTLLSSVVGIWICGIAADKLGEHDFGGIVWDEIAGFLITMWFVAFSWQNLILGF